MSGAPDRFEVTDEFDGERVDRWLARLNPDFSRSRFKDLVKAGHLRRGGEAVADPSAKVRPGEIYELTIPPLETATPKPEAIALSVLYEDPHLIVIDKPAGLVVHPAAGHWTGTLVNALLHHCAGELSGIGGVARPGIVHRLDKDTSGVMVAAKTDAAHRGLRDLFQVHDIDRTYLAVVRGGVSPLKGTVDRPIRRAGGDAKRMALCAPEDTGAKHAVTHYETLERFAPRPDDAASAAASLMQCRLETGRTHQIRLHMADGLGAPVIGDPVYGVGRKDLRLEDENAREAVRGFSRQALHASALGFRHPITSVDLAFSSPHPHDMAMLITRLRAADSRGPIR